MAVDRRTDRKGRARRRAGAGLLALLLAAPGMAAASAERPADARTAEAVIAEDKAWGDAEMRGDAAFVDWLLLPGYRSIGHDGQATDKATIVDHTRDPERVKAYAAKVSAAHARWPSQPDVTLYGDTAILAWTASGPTPGSTVRSCDIFIYRDGHWHAVYSQHSDPPA
jgi:hypothetical protein